MDNLEQALRKHLTDEQWDVFSELCLSNGIPFDEQCMKYGSDFQLAKYWFTLGWDARLPKDHVPVPKNADEAEAMFRLSHLYLKDNAPDRLAE